jgi:phosphoserine phosphatase
VYTYWMTTLDAIKSEVRAKVAASGPGRYAVIDFDNTCIQNDIGEAVLAYMCEHALLRVPNLISSLTTGKRGYNQKVFQRYHTLLRNGDLGAAYRLSAKMFAGLTPDEAIKIVENAIKAEGTLLTQRNLFGIVIQRGLRSSPVVLELLNFLAARRIALWIVSASPAVAVQTAMTHFKVPGNLIAVKSTLRNGAFTRELREPCPISDMKVDCIKKFIKPNERPILGIGDSMNDLAMIQYADVRVVIDRANDLVAEGIKLGWHVLDGP